MFDSGNIQSRPIPQLYQKRGLTVRTWNNFVEQGFSLVSASYDAVTVNGSATSPQESSLGFELSEVDYLSVIVQGQAVEPQISTLSAEIVSAEYTQIIVTGEGFDGASVSDVGNQAFVLSGCEYEQVVFYGAVTTAEKAALDFTLTQAIYETP